MRFARVAVVCALTLVVGSCSREPDAPETPAVLNPQVQGSLNQVMRGILFPNSNIIFDAQDRDPAAEPDPNDPTASVHPFAGTYGGWPAVENAAIALGEAANLIVLPGRTCENGKPVPLNDEIYQKGVEGLRQIAAETLKTAQSRNLDAMLDIADRLTNACAHCHDVYRDKIVDGKPIGIADRCTAQGAVSRYEDPQLMPLLEAFRWLEANGPGGAYLRESTYGFSILLTVHVVFMCLFLGLIIMMDLRLVGLGNRGTPPAEIQKRLFPWQILGFIVVMVSGVLLFYSKPLYYYGKGFFWTKMALMVLAGVNAGVIHLVTHRSEAGWESGAARTAGAASLVLWASVLVTGRLIAYEWWTTEYFLEDF